MPTIYKLEFECCGNIITLGMSPSVGSHGEYCLHCDTEKPKLNIIEDDDYY